MKNIGHFFRLIKIEIMAQTKTTTASKSKKNTTEPNTITMTQQDYDVLVKELDSRINVLRKEIAEEISKARELGDLSENHAYTVAMEKKEMNENRINELESIIAIVRIAHDTPENNFVNIGDSVEIQNVETNDKKVITIVGSSETKSANPSLGRISTDSPIGKAVYNSKIGDVVSVVLPTATVNYKILKFNK